MTKCGTKFIQPKYSGDCIFVLRNPNLAELWTSAITVQSQKAEIFQVGKRNISNRKIMDKSGQC